jgi:uncharacterized repeat protein (TIGR01451 family)
MLEDRLTPSINPSTPFELDGNVQTQSATTHDWDQIFADAGSPAIHGSGTFTNGPTSHALAGSFLSDELTGDDIYTGGGTKDTLGVNGWLFKTGKPQDKDEITDAFATAYTDPNNGHLLLYAGLDRFSSSGDSTAGFWFFQNKIAKSTNANVGGNGAPFTGVHSDGDILLVSDFTIGGSASTIHVFRWTGNDATGSLVALNNGNPINGDTFAIVNGGPVAVPWSYTDKSGSTKPQAGEFLEEGVDLTDLGLQGCFSSFLAETRSSQSPTATLSDFVIGGFPLCSLAAPQFAGLSKFDTFTNQGDLVTYPITVQNTGAMPLFIQSVNDSLLGNIVANHTLQAPVAPVTSISSAFNFGTPLASGASLTIFVTRPVQATDPDPTNDTTTFIGTDDLAGLADPITTSVSNSVDLFQPSVSMTESASPSAGVVGSPITYTYTVTNSSSSDSPNLVLNSANQGAGDPDSFTSSVFGDIEADAVHALAGNNTATTASLAPGASFSFTEKHVLSASDTTPLTDTSNAIFTLAQNLGAFPNRIHSNATTATVRIVNAEISIAGSGVNEINNPHTFTVTVEEDLGDGNGFVPVPAGVPVTVTLTNTNGSTTSPTTYNVTTNSSGQASVTFISATAGEVIGNASTTFSVVAGVPSTTVTRSTGDSNVGDSGPATKFFEDANISISPNATNGLTEPHTFTVTLTDNAGDGLGYVAAANEPVTVTLTGQNGAVPIVETPLSGTTDANGHFSVTFTSDSAGQVLGNASSTFTLNGVTLTRATGDSNVGDSGPATKTFVAGKILWKKVDGFGNLLGGATFLVTATGGTAAGLSPTSVTVTDNGPSDTNPSNGLFELDAFQSFGGSNLTGLALGTYTIQETTPPPGYMLDPKVLTVTLTQSALTGDETGTPFVDLQPNLNIVKTVTANQTVIHPGGTASYTITVSNPNPSGGTAGSATNVVLTDPLPDASQLTWTVTSFTGFTSATISSGLLTATEASMPGGATDTVVIGAAVPLNFFGNVGTANGDPVPSSLFEIDGNATVESSHDWNQVYADSIANPATNTAGALASSFVTDETTGDDIYTGGSTKDTLGISGWLFKTGKPQDKDEIQHAFAAQYKDPITNDVNLYVGADRFSNSGNSTLGAWFFVNPIAKSTNANVSGSGAPFTGTHATGFFDANHVFNGDILLISNFTIGGSQSTIVVYGWLGSDSNGSLVLLGQTSSTVAVVNSGNPGVAWPFTDKAGFSQPQAGEFLEEGVNLSGLGLNPCFSSFLLESRSSQSTTATLSDFILGSFQTCDVMLPNQASASASNFNNGVPITSNTVVIDLNDGMAQLAGSVGSGVPAASLTQAQLQPIVSQAVAAWAAAGADPLALSNVANYHLRIANLPDGELGWELPGQIFIDPTAQGWGWSLGSTPAPGQMDLLTVVSHEVGHVLGYGDHAGGNDLMTTTLNAGVQRLPQALAVSGPTSLLGLTAATPQAVVPAGFGMGQLTSNALAIPARTYIGDSLLTWPLFSSATIVDSLLAPAIRGVIVLPAMVQDRPGSHLALPVSLAGPMAFAPSTPVRSTAERETIGIPAPSRRPHTDQPTTYGTLSPEAGLQAEAPVAADSMLYFRERVDGAGSSDDQSGKAAKVGPVVDGDEYTIADSAAAVALVIGMAGWAAQPTDKESTKRQLRLFDPI